MVKRRLVAIMFTDIEGYTALMQKSEEQALSFRNTHREIFNTTTEKFHGEIIQYYGDGTLSIFESAVDAVHCGIAMQRAFQGDPCIPVRIGIHSGDIVISDEDIIGDCVNVASRVESLAISGSVLISDKVFDEIKNSNTIETTYLDAFKLKNVKRPLGIYAISNEGLVVPAKKEITGKLEKEKKINWLVIAGIIVALLILIGTLWGDQFLYKDQTDSKMLQSVLVLPFDNYTGREDLDYFVKGMHSSLIGDLGRVSTMRVISPTTSRVYEDTNKTMPEIAEELNVGAILEVAVHCLGDSICIQPKLTRVYPEEQQIWVQDYYEDKSQILNLYHSLTKEISERTNANLTPEEENFIAQSQTVDPQAYDLYLKGKLHADQMSAEALENAERYFNLAIEQDPNWGAPYWGIVSNISRQYQMGIIKREMAVPKHLKYLTKAEELDPNSSDAHNVKANIAVWMYWDWEKGETEFKKSLEINPNNADTHIWYAHLHSLMRRTEEALYHVETALELDPMNPFKHGLYAMALLNFGKCEEAASMIELGQSIEPNHHFLTGVSIEIFACIGEYEKAFKAWKELNLAIWEEHNVTELYEKAFYQNGWIAAQKEAIRINEEIYGPAGQIDSIWQAERYLMVKEYDIAIDLLEKGFERRDPNLPYLTLQRHFEGAREDPRYIELLHNMNLPVE